MSFFQMNAILKFDFQKKKQLRFPEVNYLNYTKKDPILHVTTTFSLKQEETRTNSVPFPHPLNMIQICENRFWSKSRLNIICFKILQSV